jgi:2-C-methyl-D-erythritol 4-phosphate cytidylyltransferase
MTAEPGVEAIVLAAGQGERLGLGPKAWLSLEGRTLLERAVATMRQVVERVIVGVAREDIERAGRLCGPAAVVVPGVPRTGRRCSPASGPAPRRW